MKLNYLLHGTCLNILKIEDFELWNHEVDVKSKRWDLWSFTKSCYWNWSFACANTLLMTMRYWVRVGKWSNRSGLNIGADRQKWWDWTSLDRERWTVFLLGQFGKTNFSAQTRKNKNFSIPFEASKLRRERLGNCSSCRCQLYSSSTIPCPCVKPSMTQKE